MIETTNLVLQYRQTTYKTNPTSSPEFDTDAGQPSDKASWLVEVYQTPCILLSISKAIHATNTSKWSKTHYNYRVVNVVSVP